MKRFALVFALTVGLAARAATTWYIAPEGRDDGTYNGKSWAQPFATLSNAVTKLAHNDTIIVSNGVYKFEKSVTIPKENITLRSLTLNPEDVVFDGQDKTRLVFADKWATKVLGITFQHARYEAQGSMQGVALYLRGSATVLSNCVFRKNYNSCKTFGNGGALYVQSFASSVKSKVYDLLVEDNALVATNATGSHYSQGAGAYILYAVVTNSIFRRNVNTNNTVGSYTTVGSGGGIYAGHTDILDCNIYSNEAVNARQSTAGYGGGALLTDASTMRNCRVWGNLASNAGGGISMWSSSRVEDCEIFDNQENQLSASGSPIYYTGSGNCGGGVVMNSGTLCHSHIYSNRLVGTVSYCGGGSGVCARNHALVYDCLIEGNSGRKGVLGCNGEGGSSGASVFSNCVIRANVSQENGMLITAHNGAETLVTDCWVVSNKGIGLTNFYAEWGHRPSHVFRNLFVCDNVREHWQPFLYSACSASGDTYLVCTQLFENCTFAYNLVSSGSEGPFLRDLSDGNWGKAGSMFFLNRCAIWECGTWMCDTETKYPWWQSQNARNCLLITVPEAMTDLGNMASTGSTAVDPKFLNETNRDLRLRASSPLVDAGGEAEDWMGQGQVPGPQDMGDGTYTIGKSGKYGVTISRNKAKPRLSGSVPDIGCFEFLHVRGFVFFGK